MPSMTMFSLPRLDLSQNPLVQRARQRGRYLFRQKYGLASLLLIFASMSVSLLYVVRLCPLDLSSDEAHYWHWSRLLDWSYYSKGPLVAWLIHLSCMSVGELSTRYTGDLGAAIRLPAILCHGGILAGSYFLASGVLRSARLGMAVVFVEATLPLVRVGSVLMTIDPPFLVCWSWALFGVWKALQPLRNSSRTGWWLLAGACTVLGMLAKYTMSLFPLAVVACLLVHDRREFRRPGIWILLTGAVVGWAPVVYWNAQHDWAGFRHILGLVLGQAGGDSSPVSELRWYGPAIYLGAQLGMLFAGWLVAFLFAAWTYRPSRQDNAAMRLVWWCSVPVWSLFAIANVLKSGQPNWPAPAYLGGIILAVAWVARELAGRHRRLVSYGLVCTIAGSITASLFVHFPNWIRPTLARVAGPPTAGKPLPVRDLDLTARLLGWKRLAGEVDGLRTRVLLISGEEPVIAATHWSIPGHLSLYCRGHPDATSLGVLNGTDRFSQYDLWRPNPVRDAQAYRGRTFLIVGELGPALRGAFDRVDPGIPVIDFEQGIPVACWPIWVCHGFRGFEDANAHQRAARY